jgi:hypothetical protein
MLRKRFLESQSTLLDQHLFTSHHDPLATRRHSLHPGASAGPAGGAGPSLGMGMGMGAHMTHMTHMTQTGGAGARANTMTPGLAFPTLPPLMSVMPAPIQAQRSVILVWSAVVVLALLVTAGVVWCGKGYIEQWLERWRERQLLGKMMERAHHSSATGMGAGGSSGSKEVSLLLDQQLVEQNKSLLRDKETLALKLQEWYREIVSRNDKIAELQAEVLELRQELVVAASSVASMPLESEDLLPNVSEPVEDVSEAGDDERHHRAPATSTSFPSEDEIEIDDDYDDAHGHTSDDSD